MADRACRRREAVGLRLWWRERLTCLIKGHVAVDIVVSRGRLKDVLGGNGASVLERRCKRCWKEVDR